MTFKEVEEIIYQELGPVPVSDLGFLAPGVWGISIIVGKKANEGYSPIYNPNVDIIDRSKLSPFKDDERILKLNGTEGEREVKMKLAVIKNTMSDFKPKPKFVENMSGISTDPERNYIKSREQEEFDKQIAKQNEIVADVPHNEVSDMTEVMSEIMNVMDKLSEKINNIDERLNKMEEPKVGKGKKKDVPDL